MLSEPPPPSGSPEAAPAGSGSPAKDAGGAGASPAAPETNSLWVGNLPSHVGEGDVMALFAPYGALDCAVARAGPRSCAFVLFRSPAEARTAVKATRGAKVKGAAMRTEFARPARAVRNLWVGGLSPSVSPEEVEEEFQKFGKIEGLAFPQDQTSAYIDFEKLEDAISAHRSLNGKSLGGTVMCVDFQRSKGRAEWSEASNFSGRGSGAPYERRGTGPAKSSAIRMREAQPTKKFGLIGYRLRAYIRATNSLYCCICGVGNHGERFCPYSYIYGLYDFQTCRGECSAGPEKHRITSQTHRKFLRCLVRVNNMPPGFRLWNLEELFSPFGPLLMWDVPRLINKTCYCNSIIRLSFGVVVFKNREDGSRAIDELNGYESGGRKLRVDWVYPSCNGKVLEERHAPQGEMNCLPSPTWITVPEQGGRFRTHLESVRRRKISKEHRALKRVNWLLVAPRFLKFRRLFNFQEMLVRRRKMEKEQEKVDLVNKMALMKEPAEEGCATSFWRDPDATFCSICGDDSEQHLELTCPYNYLSPASYSPCKARLALWGNYTTTPRYKCSKHGEEQQRDPPVHDETNTRRVEFLRCFVRANNLPEQCRPGELSALFSRFGPLRMWHVATRRSGACKGFGGIVFHDHNHADEAIEALNCFVFGDRKLRVDWAYPSLNY